LKKAYMKTDISCFHKFS